MEDNFDRLIKQKLENLDVDYNPSDWERMEEKIVEQSELNPAIEDVYLDGIVYDTLSDVDEDFNPEHWEMMKARLEDPYAIRRRLMKYKVLEVALVVLLLVTIGRLVPFENSRLANTPIAQQDVQSSESTAKLKGETIESKTTIDPTATNTKVAKTSSKTSVTTSSSGHSTAQNKVPALAASNEGFQVGTTSESLKSNPEEKNNLLLLEESEGLKQLASESFEENDPEPKIDQNQVEVPNFKFTDPMSSLALKEAGSIVIPQVEEMDGSRVLTSLPKTIKVRIGMVLGPDANYVMTPSNRSKDLDVFNQYALGYSGGFTLGFNYGHWEIETGALYSAVSYDSRNIFEIKGSFADGGYVQQGLEGAQLDILRIPLNIKYNFTDQGKWNFYAFSGVSANAALETFYKITTTDLGLSDASRNFAGRAPSPPDIEPQKAQENFDGIFEGGLLSKNLFYTANLGLGVERYFTPRMSVFLQPNFQYHFSKGLGPQTDRINSVSLLAGAKVTLKKRKRR